jgi:outer membrane protein assembly factor BamD
MFRKSISVLALASALLFAAGCHHKVQNPLANIDSKQPDKGLFDRAMDSMKHARYQEARTLLETLINTYPDSEYIARAKLAIGDSWYAEGGTAALQQAEVEYKDFQTFFPNLPEASEAQLKVANIHYKQMEKPDRDYAQAQHAAEEYKTLIQNYPDSPLVPEAKQRLREVEEVLAERQYRIANFYYLRDNMAAAQARLQSLIDSYPLYSGVDQALFDLGSLYEKEAAAIKRQTRIPEAKREKLAAEFQNHAIEAYSKIITRYPAMGRADDARHRLKDLNAPIPTPTPEALAQSKAEEESRGSSGMMAHLMDNFKKHPDVTRAAKVGEPDLQEEKIASAPALVHELQAEMAGTAKPPANAGQSEEKVGLEAVSAGTGTPAANQAPPSSSGQSESGAPPAAAPPQVNEIQNSSATAQPENGSATIPQPQNGSSSANSSDKSKDSKQNADTKQESTSKKKHKKGLRKLIPF